MAAIAASYFVSRTAEEAFEKNIESISGKRNMAHIAHQPTTGAVFSLHREQDLLSPLSVPSKAETSISSHLVPMPLSASYIGAATRHAAQPVITVKKELTVKTEPIVQPDAGYPNQSPAHDFTEIRSKKRSRSESSNSLSKSSTDDKGAISTSVQLVDATDVKKQRR